MHDPEYLSVPGGIYAVGLTLEEIDRIPARRLEGMRLKREFLIAAHPAHRIDIAGFMISKRPVARGDFALFVHETGYVTESEREGWGWTWDGRWLRRDGVSWRAPFGNELDQSYASGDRFPALQVSWNDAAAYCRWSAINTGTPVRLPSEGEWEAFAASVHFPRITEINAGNDTLPDMESFAAGILEEIGRGGLFPPGCIWEWTDTWFDRYPGGAGYGEFGTTYKVMRGGSYMSASLQRSREFRFRRCPTARSPFYGFRTAIAAP